MSARILNKKNRKKIAVSMHWTGFGICALIMTVVTGYGFSLSLRSPVLDSAPPEPLALVGVALSNNLGTDMVRSGQIPVDLPADVSIVQDALMRDALGGGVFFSDHFAQITEFTEVANLDIVSYLSGKSDREGALDYYIDTLDGHIQSAKQTNATLQSQITFHTQQGEQNQSEIKNVQGAIEAAYNNRDSAALMDAIARLDELTLVQQDHKYGRVFAQKASEEYTDLIAFSESKNTVLRANRDPLIRGVSVQLPAGTPVSALEELQIFSRETNR